MNIVILAAGSGKRMLSNQPKVLHKLAGKPLIHYITKTACELKPSTLVIVVGKYSEAVQRTFKESSEFKGEVVIQNTPLGTGHALIQALPKLDYSKPTLILYADVPLVDRDILKDLIRIDSKEIGILTTLLEKPNGYGRIIRNHTNQVSRIVEEKDATEEEKKIHEVNTGIMIVPTNRLPQWLKKLNTNNAQKEFLLTDIIYLAIRDKIPVYAKQINQHHHVLGINNQAQLASLERQVQQNNAKKLLDQGVMISDPKRFDLRGTLKCGKDVYLDINTIIEGDVILGDRVTVGPNCILKNCKIGSDSTIEPYSFIDSSEIGNGSSIGPYARLRPGTKLANDIKIGNFVELKNAHLDNKTKINHLSYIGDTVIGENVNIGAGTITCNYDGKNKNKTTIGNNVFVGSDCQLIAPLEIGENKIIAAGTTVWENVPGNSQELVLNQKSQQSRPIISNKKD